MANNLFMYADKASQNSMAGSLIGFGGMQFMRANMIIYKSELVKYNDAIQENLEYDRVAAAQKFGFDYILDCVRILMFFESYMKAELILHNFCVHNLTKEGKSGHLAPLVNQQNKRPINLDEIHAVEPFSIDTKAGVITHIGIKETTLSINVLLRPQYRVYYQFNDIVLEAIKYFNHTRNTLHFSHELEFQISTLLIERLNSMTEFVQKSMARLKPRK